MAGLSQGYISKPISAGQSSYYLTTEEKEAIEQAQNSKATFS